MFGPRSGTSDLSVRHEGRAGGWRGIILGKHVVAPVLACLWVLPGWMGVASAQVPYDFDARFGLLLGQLVESDTDRTDPLYAHVELLFPEVGRPSDSPLLDAILTPRPHLGATVGLSDGVSQAFAGLTWDLPLTESIRFEASFGGTIHDGETGGGDSHGPELGCTVLFRESAAISVAVTQRLTVTAMIDHSSNAGLCDRNDGLTHAGILLGASF